MNRRTLVYLFLLIAALSCGRDKLDEQAAKAPNISISGRAVYRNLFAADSLQLLPLANQTVQVKHIGDVNGASVTTAQTDANGNFSLRLRERPVSLIIAATINAGLPTQATVSGRLDIIDDVASGIQLIADFEATTQNGFVVQLRDATGVVPGATVHLYTSQAFAEINNPLGAIATFNSDNQGRAMRVNLPAGTYYLNASKSIDTASFERIARPIVVPPTGLLRDTVFLNRTRAVITNGIRLTVVDSLNGPLSNASVRLYTSQVLALSNDASAAFDTGTSNASGLFTRNNLPAGTYYINAQRTAGTDTLNRRAKPLVVPANGIATDTIALFKRI
ncbi:MAG: carboxypeptidase regulatory-like domain-containing protein [Chitinophagaceae bacterium]|nr:MAG: carboxypeptidase regulatory-like domain-containing protein [Chitinophagaceae bacterium]